MPMGPGRLARSAAGAAAPRLLVTALERGLDMSHRKSTTTVGAPNEHPSRVSSNPVPASATLLSCVAAHAPILPGRW
jgi:hypothetical protein